MSSGVKPWGDAEVDDGRERDIEGQQSDSVLIVKSGTNFADLSGLKLTLAATAEAGSIRNVVISGIECMVSFLTQSIQLINNDLFRPAFPHQGRTTGCRF